MSIKIVVDTREKPLVWREFRSKKIARKVEIVHESCPQGDIQIWINNALRAIIERKKVRDLNASFNDGRIFNIVDVSDVALNMKAMSVLLIEGRLVNRSTKRMRSKSEIDTLLDKYIRFPLPSTQIIYTKDVRETVARVFQLAINLSSRPYRIMNINNRVHFRMLLAIPGISTSIAFSMLEKKMTPRVLSDMVESLASKSEAENSISCDIPVPSENPHHKDFILELGSLQYVVSNAPIGREKARAILDGLLMRTTKTKMLASIPYVSKQDAEQYCRGNLSEVKPKAQAQINLFYS